MLDWGTEARVTALRSHNNCSYWSIISWGGYLLCAAIEDLTVGLDTKVEIGTWSRLIVIAASNLAMDSHEVRNKLPWCGQ